MRKLIILLFISFSSFGQTYEDIMSIKDIDSFKKVCIENNYEYMSAQPDGPASKKWPKGLSAEFFRYEQLLNTAKNQNDPSIQEHVSIEIKKTSKKLIYGEAHLLI